MRVIPSLILVAIGFSAGAAVAQYVSHRQPTAEATAARPPAAAPRAAASPASAEGTRDPKADLQGQMMWDPNSHTYQGD